MMEHPNKELIVAAMRTGEVTIVFDKADGTRRFARATLCRDLIPEVPEGHLKRGEEIVNPGVQVYYDLDKDDWRSFRWDRLVEPT